jgi:hypothetical protein
MNDIGSAFVNHHSSRAQVTAVAAVLVFALMGASALSVDDAAAASKRPAGSVKLTSSLQKSVGKVRCGKIRGSWLPGTKLTGGYFISHTQQATNYKKLASRTKGKARTKNLKTAASFKSKASSQLKSCRATTPAPTPEPTPSNQLRFAISGANGLVLGKAGAAMASSGRAHSASGSSNLRAILPSGELQDAVSNGSVQISRVIVGPNDKLYVAFSTMMGIDLQNPSSTTTGPTTGCFLAEVDRTTGVPTCVDPGFQLTSSSVSSSSENPDIQFDGAGNVYFRANGPGGQTVRRVSGGVGSSLIDGQNIQLNDFLVQSDGSVLLSGLTRATGASWFRRLTPTGGVQTLRSAMATFMKLFPDGNAYMGFASSGNSGIRRLLSSTGEVEQKYWTASSSDPYGGGTATAYFPIDPCCWGYENHPGPTPSMRGFCGNSGAFIAGFAELQSGKVVALAGSPQHDTSLMQYFPTVTELPTSLTKISNIAPVGNRIAISGLNASGQNVLVINHVETGVEETILGPDNETEVYHLRYSQSDGKVYFDGLRFADNKYVLGTVDVATTAVQSQTLTSKPEALETFR